MSKRCTQSSSSILSSRSSVTIFLRRVFCSRNFAMLPSQFDSEKSNAGANTPGARRIAGLDRSDGDLECCALRQRCKVMTLMPRALAITFCVCPAAVRVPASSSLAAVSVALYRFFVRRSIAEFFCHLSHANYVLVSLPCRQTTWVRGRFRRSCGPDCCSA